MAAAPKMILWTGPVHSGKTTKAGHLVERLRAEGLTVAGLLAPSVYEGGVLAGFDGLDLSVGRRFALLRRPGRGGALHVGPFAFDDAGLRAGRAALAGEAARRADLLVVDEFGPLELRGQGWRPAVEALVGSAAGVILLVVREGIVRQVRQAYAALDPAVVRSADDQAVQTAIKIVKDASG